MKITCHQAPPRTRLEAGTTLVEILVSSSIAVMVLTAFMVLVVESSTEQRWGLAETQVHAEAGYIQDRITRVLREMSASEGSIFGDPVEPGGPFFRRVIVAQGKAPSAPRQELLYNINTQSLLHDPDRSALGDEILLHDGASPVKLRKLYFFGSMKPGGIPDASTINVWFEVDDNGAAGRTQGDGAPRNISVVRSFTVTMRNM